MFDQNVRESLELKMFFHEENIYLSWKEISRNKLSLSTQNKMLKKLFLRLERSSSNRTVFLQAENVNFIIFKSFKHHFCSNYDPVLQEHAHICS